MLSIIVVFHERISLTRECIRSIYENTQVPFEIVLVNNGSKSLRASRLLRELREKNNVRIVSLHENKGCASGRNAGLKAISGDSQYIAILDNDCKVLPEWDKEGIEQIQANGLIAIQALILKNKDIIDVACYSFEIKGEDIIFTPKYQQVAVKSLKSPDLAAPRYVNVIMGVLIAKKELYDEIGYYDENCHGMEDWDISLRLNSNKKLKVMFVPSCRIIHDHKRKVMMSRKDIEYEKRRYDPLLIYRTAEYLYKKHGLHFISQANRDWLQFLISSGTSYSPTIIGRLKNRIAKSRYEKLNEKNTVKK